MKLETLLTRAKTCKREPKSKEDSSRCVSALLCQLFCRLKDPFAGTNARRGKQLYCHQAEDTNQGRREGSVGRRPTLRGLEESAIQTNLAHA